MINVELTEQEANAIIDILTEEMQEDESLLSRTWLKIAESIITKLKQNE